MKQIYVWPISNLVFFYGEYSYALNFEIEGYWREKYILMILVLTNFQIFERKKKWFSLNFKFYIIINSFVELSCFVKQATIKYTIKIFCIEASWKAVTVCSNRYIIYLRNRIFSMLFWMPKRSNGAYFCTCLETPFLYFLSHSSQ